MHRCDALVNTMRVPHTSRNRWAYQELEPLGERITHNISINELLGTNEYYGALSKPDDPYRGLRNTTQHLCINFRHLPMKLKGSWVPDHMVISKVPLKLLDPYLSRCQEWKQLNFGKTRNALDTVHWQIRERCDPTMRKNAGKHDSGSCDHPAYWLHTLANVYLSRGSEQAHVPKYIYIATNNKDAEITDFIHQYPQMRLAGDLIEPHDFSDMQVCLSAQHNQFSTAGILSSFS